MLAKSSIALDGAAAVTRLWQGHRRISQAPRPAGDLTTSVRRPRASSSAGGGLSGRASNALSRATRHPERTATDQAPAVAPRPSQARAAQQILRDRSGLALDEGGGTSRFMQTVRRGARGLTLIYTAKRALRAVWTYRRIAGPELHFLAERRRELLIIHSRVKAGIARSRSVPRK